MQIWRFFINTQHLMEFVEAIQRRRNDDVSLCVGYFMEFDASYWTVFTFANIEHLSARDKNITN